MTVEHSDKGINASTVLGALWQLDHTETPVSAERVAGFLKCSEGVVLKHLHTLKVQRIVKDYRRKGERVWGPWR